MIKKALLLLLTAGFFLVVMASCKSSEKCPAYGEKKKYRIEKAY